MPNQFTVKSPRPVIVPIGPSIAYVELTLGQYALIDREDAEWAAQWNWYAFWDKCTRHYYASRNERMAGAVRAYRRVRMHAAILALEDGLTADHILPGNGLDNRRANLRPANRSQQSGNQRTRKDNKHGLKGVTYRSDENRFVAQIRVNGRHISLGRHLTAESAHAAYCAAAKQHFGEFARTA